MQRVRGYGTLGGDLTPACRRQNAGQPQRGHAPHTEDIRRTEAKPGGTSISVASQRGRVGCVHRIKVVF